MGHTGTGLLLDGSSILFNPGAVSFLDSMRLIQAGCSFILSRGQYLEAYAGYQGQPSDNGDRIATSQCNNL